MEITKNEALLAEYRRKAEELVAKMTLHQKVQQTLNWAPAIEELGIKAYNWWNEGLHGVARAGVATVFPQAITMAASFDEDLLEQVADVISTEGRAKYNNQQKQNDTDIYKGLTFWSPNVNIFRDPRWGRGHETFGEDPYLTSRMGVRFVEGIQGHDEKYLKAAACAKHFAVHSGPEAIRHSFNAEVSNTDLYETYLPAFRACVTEGKVEAVMGAYNRTNGDPCCGNRRLLKEILRDEWGFQGHVVSDCWAISDFYKGHKVVDGPVEAVSMAMNNGCDLNCGQLFAYLEKAVEQGLVKEERIDEALVNLFSSRMKLGILEETQNNPYDTIEFMEADKKEFRVFNRRVAEQCMVLLKNQDHTLPLEPKKLHTVGVIGPNADSRRALIGNYMGTASRYITVLEGIEDYLGDEVRVLYSEGCHLYKDKVEGLGQVNDRISEVKGVCEHSDVVICCVGLDSSLEGEEGDTSNQYASGDKLDLKLPGLQEEVLHTAFESGKPVVVVLMAGSAIAMPEAEEKAAAILYAGYPGAQGGAAAARVLFGEVSPEGKLPVTFYRTTEELPEFTDYSMKNRTYRYMKQKAMYPFGYGLSYTSFAMTDAAISSDCLAENGIDASVTVTNNGETDGAQVVQVYVKVEGEETPNAQLKAFCKVRLKKGESKRVTLHLPQEAFGLYDETCKKKLAGDCLVYIGSSQPDERSAELTGSRPDVFRVHIPVERYL